MFGDIYKNQKVLITGASGFKGTWLCWWLKQLGANVYGVGLSPETEQSMFKATHLESEISFFYQDIRNKALIIELVNKIKPRFIFHLAAQALVKASLEDPILTFETDILGTANLLEAIRTLPIQCFGIIITSDKCYENREWHWGYRETDRLGGKDPYSASKAAAEIFTQSFARTLLNPENNLQSALVTTRAGNVIGGGTGQTVE